MNEANTRTTPLTVQQLTFQIKGFLEQEFPQVWLVGEISNFKRASSGHFYFSLKDDSCQIRCNMWRSRTNQIRFRPEDGMEVLVFGSLNVYPPRGEYSLVVDHMEELGRGRLRQEFERLKGKLQAEGLFHTDHKKPLPLLPQKIGIVTSPTGAAIRDMLRVLDQRFSGLNVLIYPARVQGDTAAEEIAEGITWLDEEGQCDLIIAGRGGGSEEDLWCFNEEIVARAIFQAKTPIISAVGHEVDFTIADFTADVRASTPSNAAELAVKTREEYHNIINLNLKQMDRAIKGRLLVLKNRVKLSESHPIFIRVRARVNDHQRRIVDLEHRLRRRLEMILHNRKMRLLRAGENLHIEKLEKRLSQLEHRLENASRDLTRGATERFEDAARQTGQLIARLEDLSPLKILSRGYAAVFDQQHRVVRGPKDVSEGDVLQIRLAEGDVDARVISKEKSAVQEELF